MGKFLDKYTLGRLTQEETEGFIKLVTNMQIETTIETIIKYLPLNSFTSEFYENFKEFKFVLLKLFLKVRERMLLNTSNNANSYPNTQREKSAQDKGHDSTREENYRLKLLMCISAKISKKIQAN